MAILSKACKPDNFESHNSLRLSFTNIWGLGSNFVDYESFLESNSPDILSLCEANLDGSNDSGNWSTHLLMFLSLETLTSMIRTGLPILVELIDLVNSVIISLSQTTILRWLTFLLASQTVILTVPLFWIYLFLLTLVFVLQWLSLRWEILIMLLSQFPLTLHHIHNGMSCFIALLMTILVMIGTVSMIIWEIFYGWISLNSVLLLLLMNFVSGIRLEFMYISLIESIKSSLTRHHGFQLLLLLP